MAIKTQPPRYSKPLPYFTGVLVLIILLTTLFLSLASQISVDDEGVRWNYTTNSYNEVVEFSNSNTTNGEEEEDTQIHSGFDWYYIPLFVLLVGFEMASLTLLAWTCTEFCCTSKCRQSPVSAGNKTEQDLDKPPPEYQPPPPYVECVIDMNEEQRH
ncbi:unnamed protein product [Orchesella dallaii]|uniref:Uncharacterized protein n=1 Tax=Orchesella dallaii TaxID=48710 RepID=A0ABP1S9K7_9HEXA